LTGYEAGDPTGHLPTPVLLVFEPGKLNEDNVLITGQFAVLRLDLRPSEVSRYCHLAGRVEYVVGYAETAMRREALGVGFGWEDLGVLPADVFKNTRGQFHPRS